MTDASYEVRRACLGDWAIIKPFVEVCYGAGAPFKDRPRWIWQFIETPYPKSESAGPSVWIAVKDGEVAGQIAVQPGRVWVEGESVPMGWIVDVMVAPQHRGRGLGHLIHDAVSREVDVLLTLTMAAATRRIAERADCITLGPVRQMVRIGGLRGSTLSSVAEPITDRRPALRAVGRLFNASRLGPWLAAKGASAALAVGRAATASRYQAAGVRQTAALDLELCERLFQTERAKITALCDRGRDFCDWRINRAPDLPYAFGQLGPGNGSEGVVIWRRPSPSELNIGVLVDVIADPDDIAGIRDLAGYAVQQLAADCEAIIAGASHPNHVRALADLGFITLKLHRPTIVCGTAELRSLFARTANAWHFTKADHDWDQIHPKDH